MTSTSIRAPRSAAFVTAGVLAGAALLGLGLFVGAGSTPVDAAAAPSPEAAPMVAAGAEFPTDWYFIDRRTGERYKSPIPLEGKPAPTLKLTGWVGEPVTLEKLEGKVVVVDFWGTWCGPCVRALPHNVRLVEQYGEHGLALLGVHDAQRGSDRMADVAKAKNLNYPTAVDDGGVSAEAWKVSFWPTYAVVDHKGIVRAAGLRPDRIENVVKILLEERKRDL